MPGSPKSARSSEPDPREATGFRFEQSLARIEEIVRRLESPDLQLDEAMKLFEEGIELSRQCQKQLEEAEARVEILLKKADGKVETAPFEPEENSTTSSRTPSE
jgi:exodeoxyribonuclease VII small subunit